MRPHHLTTQPPGGDGVHGSGLAKAGSCQACLASVSYLRVIYSLTLLSRRGGGCPRIHLVRPTVKPEERSPCFSFLGQIKDLKYYVSLPSEGQHS